MPENHALDLIIQFFEDVRQDRTQGKCGDLYCSTCGGVVSAVYEKMDEAQFHLLAQAVKTLSDTDKPQLIAWRTVIEFVLNRIRQNNQMGKGQGAVCDAGDFFVGDQYFRKLSIHEKTTAIELQQTERETMDFQDVRAVDRYLYEYKNSLQGDHSIFQQAVDLALTSKEPSLVETLIIVLGENSMDYPGLVELALVLSKENRQLQRVLYNVLREERVDVRDYIGDGNTVDPLYADIEGKMKTIFY